MKRTELAKYQGKKLDNRLSQESTPGRFGSQSALPDRREQRRRDQALGLVPLAVKVDGGLLKALHALAAERGASLNDVVSEILTRGLKAK
ncbi:MAG TPA: hypothetical protein VHA15_15815 [Burkholderiales bacterium]|jgi:hypothetical protein|nr:hypothetical protein [Burkholderiales bacterium]